MMGRIATIFKDHPSLMTGFNPFLPKNYSIDVNPLGDISLSGPEYIPLPKQAIGEKQLAAEQPENEEAKTKTDPPAVVWPTPGSRQPAARSTKDIKPVRIGQGREIARQHDIQQNNLKTSPAGPRSLRTFNDNKMSTFNQMMHAGTVTSMPGGYPQPQGSPDANTFLAFNNIEQRRNAQSKADHAFTRQSPYSRTAVTQPAAKSGKPATVLFDANNPIPSDIKIEPDLPASASQAIAAVDNSSAKVKKAPTLFGAGNPVPSYIDVKPLQPGEKVADYKPTVAATPPAPRVADAPKVKKAPTLFGADNPVPSYIDVKPLQPGEPSAVSTALATVTPKTATLTTRTAPMLPAPTQIAASVDAIAATSTNQLPVNNMKDTSDAFDRMDKIIKDTQSSLATLSNSVAAAEGRKTESDNAKPSFDFDLEEMLNASHFDSGEEKEAWKNLADALKVWFASHTKQSSRTITSSSAWNDLKSVLQKWSTKTAHTVANKPMTESGAKIDQVMANFLIRMSSLVEDTFGAGMDGLSMSSSSPAKSEKPQRHDATCDFCDKWIVGKRWKCLDCPDFDCCDICQPQLGSMHPHHQFIPIEKASVKIRRHYSTRVKHPHIVCDHCDSPIQGVRYKCTHPSCVDFDLCENCEALPKPVHPIDHLFLKIRQPVAHRHQMVANSLANARKTAYPSGHQADFPANDPLARLVDLNVDVTQYPCVIEVSMDKDGKMEGVKVKDVEATRIGATKEDAPQSDVQEEAQVDVGKVVKMSEEPTLAAAFVFDESIPDGTILPPGAVSVTMRAFSH